MKAPPPANSFEFEGPNLCRVIAKTFERRGTAPPKGEPIAKRIYPSSISPVSSAFKRGA